MPTRLGPKFSVNWRGHPPQMLSPDHPVWYRFLDKYGKYCQNLWYNCWVGGPIYTEEELKKPMAKMWQANKVKRIDALMEFEDEIWIIEVRSRPGVRTLGQLLTYQTLWLEDPKIFKPEKLVLVCVSIGPDIGAAAAKFGVEIYVLPEEGEE